MAMKNRMDGHYSLIVDRGDASVALRRDRNFLRQVSQRATNGDAGPSPNLAPTDPVRFLGFTIVSPHPTQSTWPPGSAMTLVSFARVKGLAELELPACRLCGQEFQAREQCGASPQVLCHRSRCLGRETTYTVQSGVGSAEVRTLGLKFW